jgi:Tol biopolymer transport system component
VGLDAGLPLVSPDGKFLFFTAGERGKSDIYWVDAKILDKLRPKVQGGQK